MTREEAMGDSLVRAEGGSNHCRTSGDRRGQNSTGDKLSKSDGDALRTGGRYGRSESSSEEVVIDKVQDYIPTPPDGGWGWVIVVSSLFCNMIVDGIGYTFGVFLLEFLEAFKESKSKVSLVGSLLCGVYLFVGPIVSAMTNKFGCRPVVIAGSVISSTAFVLARFSPNIEVLTVTYGFIGGFGLGMIYLPSIVSVGFYFDTKRAFATGLAVCGSGLGTFVFPPLSEYLLTEFSWQGGVLIIAGIMLQGCVCGTLMRPLVAEPSRTRSKQSVKVKQNENSCNEEHFQVGKHKTTLTSADHKMKEEVTYESATSAKIPSVLISDCSCQDGIQGKTSSESSTKPTNTSTENSYTTVAKSAGLATHATNSDVGVEMDMVHKLYHELATNTSHTADLELITPLLEVSPTPLRHAPTPTASLRSLHISKQDLARPLYRKDIFYSGSVSSIPEFRSQPSMKSYITSVTRIPGDGELHGPSTAGIMNCSCLPKPAQDVLAEMLDVSLLKDLSFLLILLGNFLAFLGMYVPFVFIVDRAILLGLQRSQATFLISIIGITNTAGRIAIGKVVDLHLIDSLVTTYIALFIMGVSTGVVPFCNIYPTLIAAAGVFGLGMAAYISMSSIIICDRMGLEKLTNAFGLLTLVRGVAGIAGPPLAGFMFDSSGSYDLSFFIGGILLVAGGACLCLLHIPALRPPQRNQ